MTRLREVIAEAVDKALADALRGAFNPEAVLTERQVAAEYNIPIKSLQQYRYRGNGPRFLKLGRSVRYRRRDIQAWFEKNEVKPRSEDAPPHATRGRRTAACATHLAQNRLPAR